MKLTFGGYNLIIQFHENQVCVLTVENPQSFLNILQNLEWQCRGEEGTIVLSEEGAILPMMNQIEIIWNPLLVDINAKKILNRLYQEMKIVASEECCPEFRGIQQAMGQYLNTVGFKLPYDITYNVEVDHLAIYKLCDVQLELEEIDVQKRLIEYIKVLSMLCNLKLLVLVNIKSYLSNEQLSELYKTAFYYKINVLLIESTQKERLEGEKQYILDHSDCLIELE
ncbi:MAG: type II-A CRISPR-associated protein Csn2 [Lachnospiraceae bacterium]|nr:type II-A CRISPR-associated protein Csn2 [Lachnospiraceae bacterium]